MHTAWGGGRGRSGGYSGEGGEGVVGIVGGCGGCSGEGVVRGGKAKTINHLTTQILYHITY